MTRISQASAADASAILALQKLAFQYEAEIYDDFTIPPLVQSLDSLRQTFANHVFLKAVADGQLVGSVRASQDGQTCLVGRLIVHPGYRRRGIGTELMRRIEARFEQAVRFELFTGHSSAGNLRLYTRLGYREFRREETSPKVTLAFMEKIRRWERPRASPRV